MAAHIAGLEVHKRLLSPAEAEIWITVRLVEPVADAEICGQLIGPRCPYATTIEVAYPFRPVPGHHPKPGELTARVLIPEPSFWDPESPFLYQGSVEVRTGGKRWHGGKISLGLGVFQLGKRGLLCNGRPLLIRGLSCRQLSAADALQLRREGYNTLLCPVSAETAPLWDAADRFGFLVLGRLSGAHVPDAPAGAVPGTDEPDGSARDPLSRPGPAWLPAAIRQAEALKYHVSCLGWLLPQEALEFGAEAERAPLHTGSAQLVGVELEHYPRDQRLPGIHFIFAKEDVVPPNAEVDRPILLRSPPSSRIAEGKEQVRVSPAVLGWIVE